MFLMRIFGFAAMISVLIGAPPATADEADIVFWNTISASTDGAEYCAYLETFPTGKFAALARVRAKKYGGTCAGAPTAAAPAPVPTITAIRPGSSGSASDGTYKLSSPTQSFFTTDNYLDGVKAFDRQDYETAIKLWLPEAEAGRSEAQALIGNLYNAGFGFERDYAKAMEWFMKAAVKGDAMAQQGIGNLYGEGRGVEKDYIKARMWFAISANNGNERAEYNMRKVAQRMKPAEVEKADQMALEWIKKHSR